jgi:hypothetical protein
MEGKVLAFWAAGTVRRHDVVLGAVSGEAVAASGEWYTHDPERVLRAVIMGDPAAFYGNAARFLGLGEEVMAAHHARSADLPVAR